ncbi:hypothetical protein AALC17_12795 [Oscillospiraceae bacterium 38-13]
MKRAVLAAGLGALAGGALVKKLWREKYREQKKELALAGKERDLLYTWLLLEQKGANPSEYFAAHGFHTVAILGMNREGRRFYDALKDHVNVAYAVELDNFSAVHEHMTVYRLGDDPLPPAECMVVCDLNGVREKLEAARGEFKGEIVTLTEVLAWLVEAHQLQPGDGTVKGWPPEER